ncbi:MAG TPA: AmmeMemoRadiSam system protein B [Patescibacteria group bacterium]|nr:AmmeMemoRadiSam system protein B [Patescibacteria group bacterium]
MSLVFGAIVPHPPILIPQIGKDNLDKIAKTKESMEQLERELYASKPDIIMIISPHGMIDQDVFTVNLSNYFTATFEEFGDFSTKLEIKGDTVLIAMEKEKIENKSPINIISDPKLDHGVGVPYFYLAQQLKNVSIIPIYFSLLDSQAHIEFGKNLKEVIMDTEKRVAVIASGDMSHCLTETAPAPFNPAGKQFDEKLIELLKKGDIQGIVGLDQKLVEDAAECGLKSALILLGVLHNINFTTEILSYEAPFGVGYLVANFKLE